ncbi:hypothetical protein ACPOL_0956 [Acidisarcina polymorpha]|uniref:Alpha/beta hydrolase domain-containing protein n=1 Tax=Acidisarcina polymorpha TaxID=2211140 RepID=A0A2Z5FTY1_9BACT|nr:alpha/beta hydrolase domain-containing protein [Acidisarcina polymorpha]AXC10309.1 hypothetical protein ACPOL_0956 [Acidisarcina polymorpha]
MNLKPGIILAFILSFFIISPVSARVSHVDIFSHSDVLSGRSFGDAGAYEHISGRIYFSLPIANPHNQGIVDLHNAINLRDGEVEFSSDFVAIRPKDPARGNGSMILELPNRSKRIVLSFIDGGDADVAEDAGDAWLLRNGYTIVTLGWQWDVTGPGALHFYAPIAKENGKTIFGLLRGDIMLSKWMPEIPLGHVILGKIGGTEYPVSAPDDPRNSLTVRNSPDANRTLIPRSQWKFAHIVDSKLVPSDQFIHLNGGFQPGKIYEYVYVAADPVVAGGAFAAVRDFASYAKHSPNTIVPVQRVFGQGISQTGRFLRDFLYQGFNADEDGKMALDGVLAHVAGAGRGSFNYRFAQPSRDAQPTSSVFFPTDIFPFTDLPERDPVTKEVGGLLDRATAENVVPRIFFTNTSFEYWGRAAALIHVSADGKHDAPIANSVRIYHFTGLQHFPAPFPPVRGKDDLLGQEPQSPLSHRYLMRAMIANMDAWVRNSKPPPVSSYPLIADENLVPLQKYAFPAIRGLNRPHDANEVWRLDFGPNWRNGILSVQPPSVGKVYPVLVPQVDIDGNERDGVHLPEITVPLATYTGWNLRDPSIGASDQRVAFEASYIPFAKTAAEREKTGDRRKSIAERYANHEDYTVRYQRAVDELIKENWILPEDRAALLLRGEQEWSEAVN